MIEFVGGRDATQPSPEQLVQAHQLVSNAEKLFRQSDQSYQQCLLHIEQRRRTINQPNGGVLVSSEAGPWLLHSSVCGYASSQAFFRYLNYSEVVLAWINTFRQGHPTTSRRHFSPFYWLNPVLVIQKNVETHPTMAPAWNTAHYPQIPENPQVHSYGLRTEVYTINSWRLVIESDASTNHTATAVYKPTVHDSPLVVVINRGSDGCNALYGDTTVFTQVQQELEQIRSRYLGNPIQSETV